MATNEPTDGRTYVRTVGSSASPRWPFRRVDCCSRPNIRKQWIISLWVASLHLFHCCRCFVFDHYALGCNPFLHFVSPFKCFSLLGFILGGRLCHHAVTEDALLAVKSIGGFLVALGEAGLVMVQAGTVPSPPAADETWRSVAVTGWRFQCTA
ncbi:uncharacterized protein [Physcomitrium patens]|uniref:Uncharacterized protein n=1 Tax=Physcomitrium patens TaxID=3218 RepID=A9RXL6_PHYPA|nr:hypothetical protein PHYPA_018811 [Physcomitrium patens]